MNKKLKLVAVVGMALSWSLIALAQASTPAQKQTPPAGGPAKPFVLPQSQTFSLPNGLQVTMVPYGKVPKVTIVASVRAGNINEPANQISIADLTGRMMKEGGTSSRTAIQVAQEAASMGGAIDVATGPDRTQVSTDVLADFGTKAVALIADVVQHPLLPESDLARMKQDAIRDLAIARSQSGTLAREQFYKTLYPDHPYGRLFSTDDIISKFTIADVHSFYKDNFGAARTHIYVAGVFDSAAMKKAITDEFSGWAHGAEPLINIPKPVAKRSLTLVDRPNATQSTIYMGLPVIDPSNPEFVALSITNTLLGGSFGSRITSNIREQKGYTYSPFGQVSTRYRDGFWAEVADVTTAVTGPSLKEIFFEIDRLQKEAPSADELKGIQDYISGVFTLQNSTRSGIIGQLAYADLHGLGDKYLENYVQRVYAVTPQQVQQMTQKYLLPDKMTIVVVGDKAKINEQLTPYQAGAQ